MSNVRDLAFGIGWQINEGPLKTANQETDNLKQKTKDVGKEMQNTESKANKSFAGIGSSIKGAFSTLGGIGAGIVSNAFENVGKKASTVFENIGKAAKGSLSSLGNTISNIGSNALKIIGLGGIGAGIAGGFGLFEAGEKAIETGNSLYQLSQKLNLSTKEASELNRILKLTDTDTKPFISTMERMDKAIELAGSKGNNTTKVLDAFGIKLTDTHGKLLPINNQLDVLVQGFKKAQEAGLEDEYATSLFGAKAQQMVPLLQDYADAKETASKVKGIGVDPKAAHEAEVNLKAIKLQFSQLGLAAGSAVLPMLNQLFPKVLGLLGNIASFISAHEPQIQGFFDKIGQFAGKALDGIIGFFDDPALQDPNGDLGNGLKVALDKASAKISAWWSGGGGEGIRNFFKNLASGLIDILIFTLTEAIPKLVEIGVILGIAIAEGIGKALKEKYWGMTEDQKIILGTQNFSYMQQSKAILGARGLQSKGGISGIGESAYDNTVGHNAGGTDNWRGGLSIVGERGPELVNMPRGSSITPAEKTSRMLSGSKGATINMTNNFTINGGDGNNIALQIKKVLGNEIFSIMEEYFTDLSHANPTVVEY